MFSKLSKYITDKATFKSMVANMVIKGLSLIISYLYVPLLLDYFGDEKYGLWATLLSIGTWITLCDIGIGGGLRNILTEELTKKQHDKARESVSTAYVVLSVLTFLLWIVLLIITFLAGWKNVFNTSVEIDSAVLISISFICLNFVLSLVNVILYALQVSEQVGIVNLIGGLINIAGIIIIARFSKENLTYVSIVYGMSTVIPTIINNVRIFSKYSNLRPSIRYYDKTKTRKLLSLGIVFFVLQIGGLMLSATDNIIISRLFGSVEVTPVDIATKLLSIVKSFYAALVIPVWARTTKAITEKDFSWLSKMYKQLILFLTLFGMGIVVLSLIIHPVCKIWLGKDIDFGEGVVFVIALGTFAEMINTSYYSMLNGLGLIKLQMYIAIIQIVVNIPLSIFLATSAGMGVLGVKLATTILFSFGGIIYIFYTWNSIQRLKRESGRSKV